MKYPGAIPPGIDVDTLWQGELDQFWGFIWSTESILAFKSPRVGQEHHVRLGQCRWSKGAALSEIKNPAWERCFGAFEIPVVWSEQLILEAKLLPLFPVEDSLYLGVASPISGRSFNITSSFWLKPSERILSLNLESCFTILMCP